MNRQIKSTRWLSYLTTATCGALLAIAVQATAQSPESTQAIVVSPSPSIVTFTGGTAKSVDTGTLKVRIAGPDGHTVYESVSGAGLLDWVPKSGLPDGRYQWDAWYVPQSAQDFSREERAAKRGDEPPTHYRSGSFRLESGSIVNPERAAGEQASLSLPERAIGLVLNSIVPPAAAQHSNFATISDDDEDNGVFFTMSNVDNSGAGICNEDGNLELFVDGVCFGDAQEMLIQEGSPTNSIFVESTGDIGLGTSTPDNPLHIVDTIPLVQYERTGSNSWVTGPIGSSAELFVIGSTTLGAEFFLHRDAPGGSLQIDENGNVGMGTSPESELHILDTDFTAQLTLEGPAGRHKLSSTSGNDLTMGEGGGVPAQFILRGGAPSGSLVVDDSGDVGIGDSSPDAPLHVQRADGNAGILVREDNSTVAIRELFKLSNNGGPFFIFENRDLSESYSFAMGATGHFVVSHQQTSGVQFRLRPDGSAEFQGDVTANGVLLTSSRETKTDFAPIDESTVLDKVAKLDVSQWRYKREPESARHVGPMAEDFQEVFGLGDGKHISAGDGIGIALSAIKALEQKNASLSRENRDLRKALDTVRQRVMRLEGHQ